VERRSLAISDNPTVGWFTETYFTEFLCYPSKMIIILVQMTTVKSFRLIRADLDLDITLVL
jgi:hypothetical protein